MSNSTERVKFGRALRSLFRFVQNDGLSQTRQVFRTYGPLFGVTEWRARKLFGSFGKARDFAYKA